MASLYFLLLAATLSKAIELWEQHPHAQSTVVNPLSSWFASIAETKSDGKAEQPF